MLVGQLSRLVTRLPIQSTALFAAQAEAVGFVGDAVCGLQPRTRSPVADTDLSGRTDSSGCSCSYTVPEFNFKAGGRSWLQQQLRAFASAAQKPPAQLRYELVSTELKKNPAPLKYDRGTVVIPPDLDNAVGKMLMKLMGFYSKKSILLQGGQRLYDAVREQADTGALQKAFATGKVFWSTYMLLSLHVWLVINRLARSQNADVKFFRQRFYMQFQQDVEHRVYAAGVQVGVTKWLKKLEHHFYESGYAMDLAVAGKGDDKLPAVILKQFYDNKPAHAKDAELLALYLLRELQCLNMTDEQHILDGHVKFSPGLHALELPAEDAPPAPSLQQVVEGK